MKNSEVRLRSIEIKNFKNIEQGQILLPSALKDKSRLKGHADILGIYGQNGSGKTAVVEVLGLLKQLLRGSALSSDAAQYIACGSKEAEIKIGFTINADQPILCEYEFTLGREPDGLAAVTHEKISLKIKNGGLWTRMAPLVTWPAEKKAGAVFSPDMLWKSAIGNNKEAKAEFLVSSKLAQKEKKSFLFSSDSAEAFSKYCTGRLCEILEILKRFASEGLFVINNQHHDKDRVILGDLPVGLNGPAVMPSGVYEDIRCVIEQIGKVIGTLIPGMTLEIKEYGKEAGKDGKENMRFEILSVRSEKRIPIRYESQGIKKLLSVMSLLIAMYNNPAVCVVIDELDAGIFEYLLGELLNILEESGKGQLIFTSHNLRPLEMIDKECLVFTTSNPKNRFIRISNIKKTNNLRDLYLRAINLGGQKEEIYAPTNQFDIAYRLKKAAFSQEPVPK